MNVDALQARVLDYAREQSATLALDPRRVVATYQLNAGGFVNASFRIGDGRRTYHLKLARDDEGRAALRQWYALRALLEPYHPPAILDWIDLGECAGLLFDVAPGSSPSLHRELLGELLPVLHNLYTDRTLADALQLTDVCTARDCYVGTLHERFTQDLQQVAASPPPFVDTACQEWMTGEVAQLRRAIDESPAFDEALSGAVHGDLWLNNLLWAGRGRWTLLDWDDLAIGDPALDLATLLGPSADDIRALKEIDLARPILTDAQQQRLPLLGRATLLDWVIDSLADWIEAESALSHRDEARREKERVHSLALRAYRERYG